MRGSIAVVLLMVASATQSRAWGQRVTVVPHRGVDSLVRAASEKPLIRLTKEGAVDTIRFSKDTLALRAGDVIVRETGSTPTRDRAFPTPHFDLPANLSSPAESGGLAAYTIAFEPQALMYSAIEGVFFGVVYVGLNDSLVPATDRKLAGGVKVLLSAPNGEVEFDSTELTLTHTNLPFAAVRLRARNPKRDTVLIKIKPTFNRGYYFYVPLVRPALEITTAPARIAGFGLEEATLNITVPSTGGDGPRHVSLSGRLSDPAPDRLEIAPGNNASVVLRSHRFGIDTIRARSAPLGDGIAIVRYDFPLLFLVMAFLGGAAGGVLRAIGLKFGAQKKTESYRWTMLRGLVLGVIVAAAYAGGIQLGVMPIPLGLGELGVFIAAAFGVIFDLRVPTAAPAGAS